MGNRQGKCLDQEDPNRRIVLVFCEGQGRLCRRKTGHRHAVGRATDVVQPHLVPEFNALRVSAVLTTDANFQVGTDLASRRNRYPD